MKFLRKRRVSRRSLIRGSGVAVSLPMLDAMVPAAANANEIAQVAPPKRVGYIYVPMGYNPAEWTPDHDAKRRSGTQDLPNELPSSLRSLDSVRDHVNVVSGMDLANAYPGSHATSNSAFLSAARAKLTESSDYYLGTTVDQIAAKAIGSQSQRPSLELSMDLLSTVGQCDNGYACVYQNNLSWSSPTTPLPSEAHPRLVFESLFGDGGSVDKRVRAMKRRASLLDHVHEEMQRFSATLGPADRNRLDSYLTSIREVERRIAMGIENAHDNPLPDLDRPRGVPALYADHARLMFDLQWLALRGDITRVVTFQLAREASTRTYPEIGVPDPHHPVTHHGNNPEKLAKVAKINAHHVSLFSEFLEKLSDTPEGDGSMLDNTVYLYGSGMGDPDRHDHKDLPVLVAGGQSMGLRGGKHVQCDLGTPMANLHLTLLNHVGVPMRQFADSSGRIEELESGVDLG